MTDHNPGLVWAQEIRGLYRHVPLNERLFAALAPTVAATLSPKDPSEAFPILWGLIDEVPSAAHRVALVALLGLGPQSGDVGARAAQVDEDRHKRTIHRRADKAIDYIVDLIRLRYAPAEASLHIEASVDEGLWYLELEFTWTTGRMELPFIYGIGIQDLHDRPMLPQSAGRPSDYDEIELGESTSQVKYALYLPAWSSLRVSWSGDLPHELYVSKWASIGGIAVDNSSSLVQLTLGRADGPVLGYFGRTALGATRRAARAVWRQFPRPV